MAALSRAWWVGMTARGDSAASKPKGSVTAVEATEAVETGIAQQHPARDGRARPEAAVIGAGAPGSRDATAPRPGGAVKSSAGPSSRREKPAGETASVEAPSREAGAPVREKPSRRDESRSEATGVAAKGARRMTATKKGKKTRASAGAEPITSTGGQVEVKAGEHRSAPPRHSDNRSGNRATAKPRVPASGAGVEALAVPSFLAAQRVLLETERATYLEQAESLRAEADSLVEEMEPGDIQFDEESGEGGTLTVDRERDLALSAQALLAVEEIEHALKKLDHGSYGICENCGAAISVARLEALPYARLCIACKSGGLSRR